jgi:hypothetical protein
MAVIHQAKKRTRMLTPLRVAVVIAISFGCLFFLETSRTDANDYDTNIVNSLRKEGYEVVVEDSGKKTELPKQIHIQDTELREETIDLNETSTSMIYNQEKPKGKPWPSPIEIYGAVASLKMMPIFGAIRPNKDAVFSFARGIQLNQLVRFVGSLRKTGFDGDIVLAVNQKHELDPNFLQFLAYHAKNSNVVSYPAELVCKLVKSRTRCKAFKMFIHKELGGYLPDPRPHRELNQLRFEYYWAWSSLYSSSSRLFLVDSMDLMFQSNPFDNLPHSVEKKVIVYEESNLKNIGDEPNNRLWLREGHERKYLHKLGRNSVLCAGVIAGGQAAIETLTRAMVNQWDVSQCTIYGCDQGHLNYLVYGNFLVGSPNIDEVMIERFGESYVMSLAIQIAYNPNLRRSRIIQGGSDNVMNKKGLPAAIVHQFDKDAELKRIYDGKKTTPYLEEWLEIKRKIDS